MELPYSSIWSYFLKLQFFESYYLLVVLFGFGALGVAALLHRFDGKAFSYPIIAFCFGWLVFTFVPGLPLITPGSHALWVNYITEWGVIVSLMGVGLKIDRSPSLRGWSSVWRLLGVTMPISVLVVALLAWGILDFPLASALLLGAVLAPTDPVLAADVQVGEAEGVDTGEEDEARFALTAEAALNDVLAFPLIYLAILILTHGVAPKEWLGSWLLVDVVYKLLVGGACGYGFGHLLAKVLLAQPVDTEQDKMRSGVGALAGTLLLYGGTECLRGYGFFAVIVGAIVIKQYENKTQSHRSLHIFAEQSEQLLMTLVLIGLGVSVAGGSLVPLNFTAVALALSFILLIRPLAGLMGLIGSSKLNKVDRLVISFFGVRGLGSLFYLAYATYEHEFEHEPLIWAICLLVVTLSVFVHGITAAPVMRYRARMQAP